MVLNEKNILFKIVEEDLKNMSASIKKLHPEAKVPVLVDGDTVIYESAIITEYIDEKYPKIALMPIEPDLRMQVREWTYACNHFFKPEIDKFKYKSDQLSEDEMVVVKELLNQYLFRLDTALKQSEWLVGNELSLADLHCFPFFRQLYRVTPQLDNIKQYANLIDWYQKILKRPSFELAMRKSD
ncbi:MAG: glutathione S-transferase [Candidatus Omnitrophota bacterium]|jgi:glutathione S-transferase